MGQGPLQPAMEIHGVPGPIPPGMDHREQSAMRSPCPGDEGDAGPASREGGGGWMQQPGAGGGGGGGGWMQQTGAGGGVGG